MSAHDPLCPSETHGLLCACALIRMVRADERATFQTVIDSYDLVVAAAAKYESTLRSAVEALRAVPSTYDGTPIKVDPATIQGVLALIDGSGATDHPEPTPSGKGMADLRAKVEALPGERVNGLWYVVIEDVLGLIDGGDGR